MSPLQLRQSLLQNGQEDQWWLCLDSVTEDAPVTVSEVEEIIKSGEYAKAQVLHVTQAGVGNPVWIDIVFPLESITQNCPHCGSVEHYQKVSVLHSAETSAININTEGYGVGVSGSGIGLGVGMGSSHGIHQSLLGQRLAPPAASRNSSGKYFTAGIVFLSLAALFYFSTIACCGFALLGIAYLVAFRFEIKAERKRLIAHKQALQAWNRMWFCKRCGNFTQR